MMFTDFMTAFPGSLIRVTLLMTLIAVVVFLVLRLTKVHSPRLHRFGWGFVLIQGALFFSISIEIPWYEPSITPVITQDKSAGHQVDLLQKNKHPIEYTKKKPSQSNWSGGLFDNLSLTDSGSNESDRKTASPETKATPEVIKDNRVTIKDITSEEASASLFGYMLIQYKRMNLIPAIFNLWIVGILFFLTTAIAFYWFLNHLLKKSELASDSFQAEVDYLVEEMNARKKLPLYLHESLGPMLCLTPSGYRIVVPEKLWEELPAGERRAILRHELAHYLRGDVWKSLVARILVLPHWFNPVSWWAARRFDESAEWACDQLFSQKSPGDVPLLAKALLKVAEPSKAQSICVSAATGAPLCTRLKRLLKNYSEEESFMKRYLVFALLLMVAGAGLFRFHLVANENSSDVVTVNKDYKSTKKSQPKSNPPVEVFDKGKVVHKDLPEIEFSSDEEISFDMDISAPKRTTRKSKNELLLFDETDDEGLFAESNNDLGPSVAPAVESGYKPSKKPAQTSSQGVPNYPNLAGADNGDLFRDSSSNGLESPDLHAPALEQDSPSFKKPARASRQGVPVYPNENNNLFVVPNSKVQVEPEHYSIDPELNVLFKEMLKVLGQNNGERDTFGEPHMIDQFIEALRTDRGKFLLQERAHARMREEKKKKFPKAWEEYQKNMRDDGLDESGKQKLDKMNHQILSIYGKHQESITLVSKELEKIKTKLHGKNEVDQLLVRFLNMESAAAIIYAVEFHQEITANQRSVEEYLGSLIKNENKDEIKKNETIEELIQKGKEATRILQEELPEWSKEFSEKDDLHKKYKKLLADPMFALFCIWHYGLFQAEEVTANQLADKYFIELDHQTEDTPAGLVIKQDLRNKVSGQLAKYIKLKKAIGQIKTLINDVKNQYVADNPHREELYKWLETDFALFEIAERTKFHGATVQDFVQIFFNQFLFDGIKEGNFLDSDDMNTGVVVKVQDDLMVRPERANELNDRIQEWFRSYRVIRRKNRLASKLAKEGGDENFNQFLESFTGTIILFDELEKRIAIKKTAGLHIWLEENFIFPEEPEEEEKIHLKPGHEKTIQEFLQEYQRIPNLTPVADLDFNVDSFDNDNPDNSGIDDDKYENPEFGDDNFEGSVDSDDDGFAPVKKNEKSTKAVPKTYPGDDYFDKNGSSRPSNKTVPKKNPGGDYFDGSSGLQRSKEKKVSLRRLKPPVQTSVKAISNNFNGDWNSIHPPINPNLVN